MKTSLILTFLTLLPLSLSAPGPIPPDDHPSTSLRERIQSSAPSAVHQTAAETILDEDDGFTEIVNDGTGTFRPILPGVRAPAANEFPESSMIPDPEETDIPTPGETETPVPTPVDVFDTPVPTFPEETESFTPLPTIETPIATEEPVDPFSPSIEPTRTPAVIPSVVPIPTITPGVITSPVPTGTLGPFPTFIEPSIDVPFTIPPDMTESPEVTPLFTEEPSLEPSIGASPEANATTSPPTSDDGDDPVCFPAEATVELEGGAVKTMDELQLGDRVRVGPAEWSEVFMFTHKLDQVRSQFVKIDTLSGHSLELTRGHYLYVNGQVVPAKAVKVGDTVMLADHALTVVKGVSSVTKRGLFNPQTVHGDIIVEGVRATTYTTAVERSMAHALLAPIRAMYSSIGWTLGVFEGGADRLASFIPSGSVA